MTPQKSQGWTALVLDTNGNGKRDAYVEGEQKVPPRPAAKVWAPRPRSTQRRTPLRIRASTQRSMVWRSATDGMVWGSVLGFPGGIVRLNPGANPPETALAEYYEVPWNDPKAPVWGFSPRGMDIDGNGVVWVALASGHLASFDRQQVQRSAERAEGDRAAMPRRAGRSIRRRGRSSRT